MQKNHPIVEFICDFTNNNLALSRCDDCECINSLGLPFPALPGRTIHAFSVSFFWELCVSLEQTTSSGLSCTVEVPLLSLVPCCPDLFGRTPRSTSCMMTLSLPGLLDEQFLKQFPTWGFWFHKNAVFLGNKLFFLHLLWKPGRRGGFPSTSCKPAGTVLGEELPAHLTGLHGCPGCPAALLPTWQPAPIAWLPG